MAGRYIDVTGADEIPDGHMKVIEIEGGPIALCRLGGEFFAVDAICTHDNYLFTDGPIDDGVIECPQHGACFDVKTGEVRRMPAVVPIRTYLTRIVSGRVEVEIEEGMRG